MKRIQPGNLVKVREGATLWHEPLSFQNNLAAENIDFWLALTNSLALVFSVINIQPGVQLVGVIMDDRIRWCGLQHMERVP